MQQIPFDHPHVKVAGALDFDESDAGLTPRRLPAWTRPQVPVFMELMVTQPSGVRVTFATSSETLELDVLATRIQMAERPPRPAVFDLVVDGELQASQTVDEGNVLAVDLRKPGRPELIPGTPATVRFEQLGPGVKHLELYLPSGAQIAIKALRIDAGATVEPFLSTPVERLLWVHHGSSISHCAEATSPARTWPAVAARLANVELMNLAFGGNCQLDQFVARTIREQPADLISLKLGINVVNMDSMRERTFTPAVHGFLDTIRERQPHTPILIVSPIFCPSAETSPGPTLPDADGRFVTFPGNETLRAGCLTLTWIRKILSRLVASRRAAGDENLHYLDGLTLFGADDAGDLPDDLHPNGAGYVRMGERFCELAFTGKNAPFASKLH